MSRLNLDGCTAVITGAAGGLGAAFAHEAARRGMNVVLADVEEKPLYALRETLAALNASVLAVPCDLRDASTAEFLAAAAWERFGAVHVILNNAGVGCPGYLWETTEEEWEWVLSVNLNAAVRMIRAFFPRMLRAARADLAFEGHVVNVASVAGFLNAPLLGSYNVSKHALVALSETLRHDLQLCGAPIGVSVLCPHFVKTGIAASERNRPEAATHDDQPAESRALGQELLEKALAAAITTPDQIARMTWDAVRERRFYIFSQPEVLPALGERFDRILAQEDPLDPYASKPALHGYMRDRLAGKW